MNIFPVIACRPDAFSTMIAVMVPSPIAVLDDGIDERRAVERDDAGLLQHASPSRCRRLPD